MNRHLRREAAKLRVAAGFSRPVETGRYTYGKSAPKSLTCEQGWPVREASAGAIHAAETNIHGRTCTSTRYTLNRSRQASHRSRIRR